MNKKTTNDLEKYFLQNEDRLIHKWQHYFDIYDSHFARFRDKEITILEIGISHGGSLQMWKNYFGPKAHIIGIDINPKCKEFEEDGIKVFIGSQSNKDFLREIKTKVPKVDILIDDGGHTMIQQITTFEELYDHVKDDGVYLCEDVHTSYWPTWGGGYLRENTFVEYSKKLIDYVNAYHSKDSRLEVNNFTKSANSIHFYDSIVVIEKKIKEVPFHFKSGKKSFEE